jgi:SNF2 family DNA or RNA helicase
MFFPLFQVDLQAQARAHRIGQKKEVLVLRLETVSAILTACLSPKYVELKNKMEHLSGKKKERVVQKQKRKICQLSSLFYIVLY